VAEVSVETQICEESPLAEPQASRLFAHGLHEDTIFNERLNFFAVFESILFAAAASIYANKDIISTLLGAFLCLVGVGISILWMWLQYRQYVKLKVLVLRAEKHLPEYERTRELARGAKRGVTAGKVLTFVIPSVVLSMWLFVLLALIVRYVGSIPPTTSNLAATLHGLESSVCI